jgi:hypothetical protein
MVRTISVLVATFDLVDAMLFNKDGILEFPQQMKDDRKIDCGAPGPVRLLAVT